MPALILDVMENTFSLMSPYLTPCEGIALDLIFASVGESRIDRTLDEYRAVAARVPKLAALHAEINLRLQKLLAAGYMPFEICTYKRGDHYYQYEPFPESLSLETIRLAWVKSGMRDLQRQQKRIGKAATSSDHKLSR